ncbi:MAG: hypothetical protein IH823_03010, partial [Candidatus Dadabacteria bacterium]|nr:hypothetical protein [Candidatus Dadabacteria bacterium]
MSEHLLVGLAAIIVLGIGAQWLSWRISLPAILLLLIFSLILVGLAGDIKMVPESAALRIAPFGNIVEQYQGDAVDRALEEILGEAEPQALLHHLVESLEKAADDPRISSVVLQLNRMGGAGLSNLQTIGRAIDKF